MCILLPMTGLQRLLLIYCYCHRVNISGFLFLWSVDKSFINIKMLIKSVNFRQVLKSLCIYQHFYKPILIFYHELSCSLIIDKFEKFCINEKKHTGIY